MILVPVGVANASSSTVETMNGKTCSFALQQPPDHDNRFLILHQPVHDRPDRDFGSSVHVGDVKIAGVQGDTGAYLLPKSARRQQLMTACASWHLTLFFAHAG